MMPSTVTNIASSSNTHSGSEGLLIKRYVWSFIRWLTSNSLCHPNQNNAEAETQRNERSDVEQGIHAEDNEVELLDGPSLHPQPTQSRAFLEVRGERNSNGAQDIPLELQTIGLKLIKIWIVPTFLTVSVTLFQAVMANQMLMKTKSFSLKPCFASLLATIIVGTTLFTLLNIQKRFRGKTLIIKLLIGIGFALGIVDVGFLVVIGWWFA